MKKRLSLILVLLLGVIMAVTLVACNKHTDEQLPTELNPPNNQTSTDEYTSPSLKFSFGKLNSVFSSIYIDEFDLARDVTYSIVYKDDKGGFVKEVPYGGVDIEMIRTEDQPLLSTVGHHTIHVTASLSDETQVSGTFDLHLKDRSGAISLVNLTFNLKDAVSNKTAHAYFGKINSTNSTSTVSVESGVTFNTWYEFSDTFRMGLSGKALESVRTSGGVTLKATGEGFPFTVEAGMTFNTYWTDNVVKVTYDLGVPKEAVLMTGKDDPEELFKGEGKYANVTAVRGVGRALQPDDEEINIYNGYYFAGWFNKADDTLWRFNSNIVGENDVELYAKWVAANYSFTLYTMGGRFAEGITNSTHTDNDSKVTTTITLDNAADLGYTVVESTSRFTLSTGEINCLTFSGFHYGIDYSQYVANVQINAEGDTRVLKFSEIYRPLDAEQDIFVKGDGDYIVIDELYNDYQCTKPLVRRDVVDAEQPVTYIKWKFNEPNEKDPRYDELFLGRISKMYTELIFRNGGWTVMGDGSVRLDKIAEWALNELIVPAQLIINGEVRPLTEIGEGALAGAKALTTVDMSRASNLTTIGTRAFALDTYLKEIILPENENKITSIGDYAFTGTDYETNFYENTDGAEFIVINKMIYKYVGPDKAVIDLSNPSSYYTVENTPDMSARERTRYNNELSRVQTIEDGAFANCKSLVSITLPRQISSIADNAFANLSSFTTLNLHKESKLVDIGSSAFDNSPILGKNSSLYNGEYDAILIGSVYFRHVGTHAKSAVIPAKNGEFAITHIAPKAFKGCEALEELTFVNEEQIVEIGSDAFIETKLIMIQTEANKDDYTAFNGILTAYYGPERLAESLNLIVPSRVEKIATNAFGQYARYFNTIQLNSNVTEIQSYAFSGASSLASVIFPDVLVDKNNNRLVNAPAIGDNAFSNSKGEMYERLFIFFGQDVITMLESLSATPNVVTDEITRSWLNLYQLHKNHFIAEDISLVEIDPSVISKTLLHKYDDPQAAGREETNAYLDRYGYDIMQNALIITSNTGIKRTASLGWKENDMKFIPVTKDGEYAPLYVEGVKKYVITYKYNGKDTGCPKDAADKNLFVVTVYDAIEGLPAFNSSAFYDKDGQIISMHGRTEENSKFWLEGLDGQVEGTVFPTFYTSSNRAEIESGVRLAYRNIHGETQYLVPTKIDGFNPNAITTEMPATLTFNFYGLGVYVLEYTYSVVQSKYIQMEQVGPIIVPINGNYTTYFRNYNINLIGQDGKKEAKALTSSNFRVVAVGEKENGEMNEDVTIPDTSKLGLCKMSIRYVSPDTLNPEGITLDVCYAVVLEADQSMFSYEIISTPNKTARIIACSAREVETIVVPSNCVIGGVKYDIIQVGYFQENPTGVFQNFENLRTVYLPESIQRLGTNTFAGCNRLRRVYTSIQSSATPTEIAQADLDTYFSRKVDYNGVAMSYKETDGESVEWTVYPVELTTFEGLEFSTDGNDLVIAGDYVKDEVNHIKYRVVGIKNEIKISKPIAEVDIYLPDTMYNNVVLFDSLDNKFNSLHENVHVYTTGSDFMFKTEDLLPSGLTELKNGVFRGCEQLANLNFSQATNLEFIGPLAFAESGLTDIDFSNNTKLRELNDQLFQNASQLKSVKLHSEVIAIGDYVFYGCKALESVSGYGDKLYHIGASAFSQCSSLTEIRITSGVTQMGANVFSTCGALTIYCAFAESVLSGNNYVWSNNWKDVTTPVVWNCNSNNVASDNLIYYVNPSDGLRYALNTATSTATVAGQKLSLSGEIVIPATITVNGIEFTVDTIGKNAFNGNDKITKVTVTSSVKTIEAYAFNGCTSLELFSFAGEENGLTTIISTAFNRCDKLVQRPTVNTMATN